MDRNRERIVSLHLCQPAARNRRRKEGRKMTGKRKRKTQQSIRHSHSPAPPGHLLPCFLVHAFCNCMGFPPIGAIGRQRSPARAFSSSSSRISSFRFRCRSFFLAFGSLGSASFPSPCYFAGLFTVCFLFVVLSLLAVIWALFAIGLVGFIYLLYPLTNPAWYSSPYAPYYA